jgi:hypothetical protein
MNHDPSGVPLPFVHVSDPGNLTDREIRACIGDAIDQLLTSVAAWGVMAPGAITDLALIAAELADNALRHSGACSMRVQWRQDAQSARLEVADTGGQMPQMKPRGGGLRFVAAISACWGFEKDPTASGKVVFAEVFLTQALSGDDRLRVLVRRHPNRMDHTEARATVAAPNAAALRREAVPA